MRKLFILLVAIFLATSAYASNIETEKGPVDITNAWIKGTGVLVSGDVVVLDTGNTTDSPAGVPTYPGMSVTGTATAGLPIYGVVVDGTNRAEHDLDSGAYVRIQRKGYCPIVKLQSAISTTAGTAFLVTSSTKFQATTCQQLNNVNAIAILEGNITGNTVAYDAWVGTAAKGYTTIKALLN